MRSSLHVGLNLLHFGPCAMVIDLKFFLKFNKGKISLFFFLSSNRVST